MLCIYVCRFCLHMCAYVHNNNENKYTYVYMNSVIYIYIYIYICMHAQPASQPANLTKTNNENKTTSSRLRAMNLFIHIVYAIVTIYV